MKKALNNILVYNTHAAPLVSFRVLFGAAAFISTLRFMLLDWVDLHFVNTQVQFKYFGFEWVHLLQPNLMYALHVLMLVASLGIMLGAFYRISAIVFFVAFTYCELIDITYYLNHYYFVSIVAFVMCWLPANAAFSVDARLFPKIAIKQVPAWTINIIKFHLLLVYFFAGIAKINADWLLHALPLKIWLPANSSMPVFGPILSYPITAYVFSWAGMLFDITIGIWLIYKHTRFWAWLVVVFFHVLTGIMFQIGVFPLVMILGTTIFFSNRFHQKFLQVFLGWLEPTNAIKTKDYKPYYKSAIFAAVAKPLLFVWVVFHVLFPLRCYVYPGNMFWTEQGYRFGWRVMLFEKAGTATFYVTDAINGREGVVDNNEFLNPHQEKQMAMQPDLILQYARFLKNHYQSKGVAVSKVRAEVYVTYNARPSKLLFDPTLNLLDLKDSWKHKDWILPLE